jgi:hypothetical protein
MQIVADELIELAVGDDGTRDQWFENADELCDPMIVLR